ncbi:Ig-like domain-containing protein [Flavobacterium microcysteis]
MRQTITIIMAFIAMNVFSQSSNKIFTTDIDNFWTAYDSIQKTTDFSKKIHLIDRLYIDKGTDGLKAFMKARNYNDTLWVKLINEYPKFWNSIRPNTLTAKAKITEFENAVATLKKLYPELKEAEMYFTIGGLRSGGTVKGNMVLVGAEIATGSPATDVSEFKDNWLKNVFAEQTLDNIVSLNIHEYIHTQQTGDRNRVLSQCIKEGSCDFIAELTMQQPLQRKYFTYGKANAEKTKELFKEEMFTNNFSNWLYNGGKKGESADLGYYIGYEICKSYYNLAKDKKQAIKDIIELNYDDDKAVESFLSKSKFFKEKINKAKLIKEYDKKLPYITGINPFKNGSEIVDSSLKELKITFSKEMESGNYSMNYSKKGKDYFPIKKVIGYENNNQTFVIAIDLQPNKEYEFIITNRSFKSKDGYPLKEEEYLVKFKTK